MFELYTGNRYMPSTSFASHIQSLMEGKRPKFQYSTPTAFRELSEACWTQQPEARPTDQAIIDALKEMGAAMQTDSGILDPKGNLPVCANAAAHACGSVMATYLEPSMMEGLAANAAFAKRRESQGTSDALLDSISVNY